mmetsp:Transcript_26434/g.40947  ORF Transcript_26434/g.40947 Transcript_26434/m.40947 type:complete len:760 (+) Transcript_26434:49-2328(+)|eukprot:CAMPEP_0196821466 /NCGR_PEP_ID=MMETSP1362-20130617/79309_1 /TAXON_ID=163516 /ORGANISM="Leptocylindrus danicus, Strain CCMP1856" /LENGTH=759 /DNA_ID=CAMNT_0042200657 /DNA_START=26 /DNA_END=2305 /DNA_ORIENTATION=+
MSSQQQQGRQNQERRRPDNAFRLQGRRFRERYQRLLDGNGRLPLRHAETLRFRRRNHEHMMMLEAAQSRSTNMQQLPQPEPELAAYPPHPPRESLACQVHRENSVYALALDKNWKRLLLKLEEEPCQLNATKLPMFVEKSLISLAVQMEAPLHVINKIIEVRPDQLSMRTVHGKANVIHELVSSDKLKPPKLIEECEVSSSSTAEIGSIKDEKKEGYVHTRFVLPDTFLYHANLLRLLVHSDASLNEGQCCRDSSSRSYQLMLHLWMQLLVAGKLLYIGLEEMSRCLVSPLRSRQDKIFTTESFTCGRENTSVVEDVSLDDAEFAIYTSDNSSPFTIVMELTEMIVDANPFALEELDMRGLSPILQLMMFSWMGDVGYFASQVEADDERLIRGVLFQEIESRICKCLKVISSRYPKAMETCCSTFGNTPLHSAIIYCQPISIISAMLDLAPQLTCIPNTVGEIPIHIAAMTNAPCSVLEILLRDVPSTAQITDRGGRTSLHWAWINYVRLTNGYRRVCIHTRRVVPEDWKKLQDNTLRMAANDPTETSLHFAWRKLNLLLKASSFDPALNSNYSVAQESLNVNGKLWRPVHAACSVNCPYGILKLACILFPNEVMEVDEDNKTALHKVASSPLNKVWKLGEGDPSHLEAMMSMNTIAASSVDNDGNTPLHYAIKSKRKWRKKWGNGVELMMINFPVGLTLPDDSSLCPFALAGYGQGGLESISFSLLRAAPDAIKRQIEIMSFHCNESKKRAAGMQGPF